MRALLRFLPLALAALVVGCVASPEEDPWDARWLTFANHPGPARGKRVVLVAAEERYRAEQSLPMLAQLLAKRHGFDCTVLFAQDPVTGVVDPTERVHVEGLEQLEDADVLVLAAREREWAPRAMHLLDDFLRRGGSIVALRPSTRAFAAGKSPGEPFAHYAWDAESPPGGFGGRVLGATWNGFLGMEGETSTVVHPNRELADDPLLFGVDAFACETSLLAVPKLPDDARVLLVGAVRSRDGAPDAIEDAAGEDASAADGGLLGGAGPKGDAVPAAPEGAARAPVAWTRELALGDGRTLRVFATTLGSARDFSGEDLRRLVVNACYWAARIEDALPAELAPDDSGADPVEWYAPSPSGANLWRRGLQPVEMRAAARGVHRW